MQAWIRYSAATVMATAAGATSLFVTTVMFAVVIGHADHQRPVWLPLLIATIVMSVVAGIYVLQGFLRSVHENDGDHDQRDHDRHAG